jgi:sulfur carrier protein ThiS adenylyltransferase
MNEFEISIQSLLGRNRFRRVQNCRVGIAGAGGLGSNCALNLVRSGFKNLRVVDFDTVNTSNLNRQFYWLGQVGEVKVKALEHNLRLINPDLNFDGINKVITSENISELFTDCDVLVEALDSAPAKKMFITGCLALSKFVIAASGLAGFGNTDAVVVKKISDRFFLVGDFRSEVNETNPPFAPKVNIVAAKQADLVLEYIIGTPSDQLDEDENFTTYSSKQEL